MEIIDYCKSKQKWRLSNAGVTNDNKFEKMVAMSEWLEFGDKDVLLVSVLQHGCWLAVIENKSIFLKFNFNYEQFSWQRNNQSPLVLGN